MGLASCHDWHPMRGHERRRTLLVHAHERWSLLRRRRPRSSPLGTICSLDHRLVKLVGPSDWRTVRRLWYKCNDSRSRIHQRPHLRPWTTKRTYYQSC